MVKQNFKYMFKNHSLLMMIICFCQVFFVMVLLFVIGIYYNNNYEQNALNAANKNIIITVGNVYSKKQLVEVDRIKSEFFNIFLKYEPIIDYCWVGAEGVCEGSKIEIASLFKIKDGKYELYDDKLGLFVQGRFLNHDDLNKDEKVCVLPKVYAEDYRETIIINNEEYKVIGYQNKEISAGSGRYWGDNCYIAFSALGKNLLVYEVNISFKRPLVEGEYEQLRNLINIHWGDKVLISKYVKEDFEDQEVRKTINYITIMIGVLASITLCAFYYFIIARKTKVNAINVLCGCSVNKIIIYQAIEIAMVGLINTAIGYFVYIKFVFKHFEGRYIWFSAIYCGNECMSSILKYMLIILAINVIYVVYVMKKEPVEILRDTKRV